MYMEWAKEASINAISLAEESMILFNAEKNERAYYLSHMASEEASKSILLNFMDLLSVPDNELPKVVKLLCNHRKKIDFIVNLVKVDNPDLSQQLEKFGQEFTGYINNLKNNSMYVTYIDGKIQKPKDAVASIDVEAFVKFGEAIARYSQKQLTNKDSWMEDHSQSFLVFK